MAAAAAAVVAVMVVAAAWQVAGMEEVESMAFEEGFSPLFGEANMERSPDGRAVRLTLNRYSGSGFISSHYYHHGFFSASIRLPADHTAGVVVAFYSCRTGTCSRRTTTSWTLSSWATGGGTSGGCRRTCTATAAPSAAGRSATSCPSTPPPPRTASPSSGPPAPSSSTSTASPSARPRSPAMAGDYPSKPMAVYATIWDGSTWATDNGRYKVNYKRGPFTAEFSDLVLRGCPAAAVSLGGDATARLQLQLGSSSAPTRDTCAEAERELMAAEYATMTARKRMAMRQWRQRQMLYTVCYDTNRYPAPFPECDVNAAERQKFWEWGESKVVRPRVRGRSSRRRTPPPALVSLQQAD
ncbi:hypothetical protein ACP70R_024057 [Stipagrostis hirtigluma subsp. patula]